MKSLKLPQELREQITPRAIRNLASIGLIDEEEPLSEYEIVRGALSYFDSKSLDDKGFCYFIQNTETKRIKIGYTAQHHPGNRVANLQTGCDNELLLIGYVDASVYAEAELHQMFHAHHYRAEWYTSHEDILSFIRDKCHCPRI